LRGTDDRDKDINEIFGDASNIRIISDRKKCMSFN
jgi:hypothetical protein